MTARKATRTGATARAPERPGVVGDPGMCGRTLYGNREISRLADGHVVPQGPHREGEEPKPMMHEREKSDPAVVAMKPTNKAERSAAEPVEPRAEAEGNASQQSTHRAQNRACVSQALDRIRQAARQRKEDKFPSRRVYIPKPDGRQRPLAVAALEDKIVQRATVAVLNAIYEEDFLGFSYGFRPGRGAHDALDALAVGINSRRVNFILDADIRVFFDTVDHDWLIRFVEHRIGDKRIIRLIQKWLKVGVLEDGAVTASDRGTGQGSVISPLLANIYLHYVFDLWAERWRRREATGDMIIVRYADDIIVGFEHEADARCFLEAMRERLGKFALSLHPGKTRLIEFGRHAAANRERRGLGKPETFNFLGFSFICGKSLRGKFLLKRKTRRDRMRAKLQAIKQELRQRRHQPIPVQGKWLRQVVKGYFNYHAVPTNSRALSTFRFFVTELWQRSLRRRGQKDGTTWERITRLANDWLPKPRILHRWPQARFAVRHPRWEKLWGGRRRSWHLHRPYEPMEVAPWPKSMISAEA